MVKAPIKPLLPPAHQPPPETALVNRSSRADALHCQSLRCFVVLTRPRSLGRSVARSSIDHFVAFVAYELSSSVDVGGDVEESSTERHAAHHSTATVTYATKVVPTPLASVDATTDAAAAANAGAGVGGVAEDGAGAKRRLPKMVKAPTKPLLPPAQPPPETALVAAPPPRPAPPPFKLSRRTMFGYQLQGWRHLGKNWRRQWSGCPDSGRRGHEKATAVAHAPLLRVKSGSTARETLALGCAMLFATWVFTLVVATSGLTDGGRSASLVPLLLAPVMLVVMRVLSLVFRQASWRRIVLKPRVFAPRIFIHATSTVCAAGVPVCQNAHFRS